MGWCHEFGSSIRHGCDEPMVAGSDSCSCTTCGIRCPGKFSSCDLVWQRGPKRVAFVRPVHGQPPASPAQAAVPAHAPGTQLPAVREAPLADVEWLATTLEAVRADVRALKVLVEQQAELLADAQHGSPPARLVELVESLPERIGLAVSRAMGAAPIERAVAPAGPSEPPAPSTTIPPAGSSSPHPLVAAGGRPAPSSADPAVTTTPVPGAPEPPPSERPPTGPQGTEPGRSDPSATMPPVTSDAGVEGHGAGQAVAEPALAAPMAAEPAGVEAQFEEWGGLEPAADPAAAAADGPDAPEAPVTIGNGAHAPDGPGDARRETLRARLSTWVGKPTSTG